MKVLILYASFGDGHRQVAQALLDMLAEDAEVEVVLVDPFRKTSGLIARLNEALFEWLTKHFPSIYGLSYDLTKKFHPNHVLWKALAKFSRKATWEAVTRYQPNIVIQLFPDHALAKLPPSLPTPPYIVTILTDFAVHSRWFHGNVSQYFLPCSASLLEAKRFLDPSAAVTVYGIPIRKQFLSQNTKAVSDDSRRDCIVVSAGGRGVFPDLEDVLRALANRFQAYWIVVLCGRNEAMKRQVTQLACELNNENECISALGFTDDVARWLRRANFVVAKAGGISIAECLACGTPMLFYRPLAGQERDNAQIVERMGAGKIAWSCESLSESLIAFQGTSLNAMQRACTENAFPEATEAIVAKMLESWKPQVT